MDRSTAQIDFETLYRCCLYPATTLVADQLFADLASVDAFVADMTVLQAQPQPAQLGWRVSRPRVARAEPAEIRAAGISILSPKVDIANVRLQFPNGCVANLTASRVSTERVRKLRLFQPQQYLSLDYGRQDLAIFSVAGGQIGFEQAAVIKAEPLLMQLEAFLYSVETRRSPKTSGPAARQSLGAALAILDKIEEHSGVVSQALAAGWKP